MELRLISFSGCPFVQRARIVLLAKQVAHEIEYVDVTNKPAWFLELSPRGRAPVLIADGIPVFESTAILEYLEEVFPDPPMYPADPILRARDRAWLGFATEELYKPTFTMLFTTNPDEYEQTRLALEDRLARLDAELTGRDWLSGDGARFGMADLAAAPFFARAAILDSVGAWSISNALTHVRAWGAQVSAHHAVRRSLAPGFEEHVRRRIAAAKTVAATRAAR